MFKFRYEFNFKLRCRFSALSAVLALGLAGCHNPNTRVITPSTPAPVPTTVPSPTADISKVGVQSFYFTNDNITNTLPPLLQGVVPLEANDSRQLLVKIWYPAVANPDENTRFHYGYHTPEYVYPFAPQEQEDLEFFKDNLVQSQTYQNAEPVDGQFPVIVYSHGLNGHIEDNEPYFESLVEQGYVVVSIGHPYEAGFVNFAPGEYALFNLDFAQHGDLTTLPEYEIAPSMINTDEDIAALGNIAAGEALPDMPLQRYFYTEGNINIGKRAHVQLWVEDSHFVVSQLEEMNQGLIQSNLTGRFDLSNIGASGHSFGGATARRFCNQEGRCLASVHLDGNIYELYDEKIINPHMSLSADAQGWIAANVRNDEALAAEFEAATDEEIIEFTAALTNTFSAYKNAHIHSADSDLVLFSPKTISHTDFHTSWINFHEFGLGKAVWHDLIKSSSVNFFDAYLKDNAAIENHPIAKLCELLQDDNVSSYYNTVCD